MEPAVLTFLASVISAVIASLSTALVAFKKAKADIESHEISDRQAFRDTLMRMIKDQQEQLNTCQKQHLEAEKEIASLRSRVQHMESILNKHGIELIEVKSE